MARSLAADKGWRRARRKHRSNSKREIRRRRGKELDEVVPGIKVSRKKVIAKWRPMTF